MGNKCKKNGKMYIIFATSLIRIFMSKEKKCQNKNENDLVPMDSYIVKQSWKLTKLKYDITKVEKNLFFKIIELCQKYEKGESLNNGYDLELVVGKMSGKESPIITFPIKDMIGNSHRDYDIYRTGIKSLATKPFHMPDQEWDFNQVNLFERVQGSEKKGVFKVKMTETFWELFHDLKIFKLIDTGVVYKFRSVFTSRMYEILVGNQNRIGYKLDNLMKLFSKETYTPAQFIKYVIKVAESEMKEMEYCPFYFEFTVEKKGKKIDTLYFDVINKKKDDQKEDISEETSNISENEEKTKVKMELNEKVKNFVITFFEVEEISSSIEEKLLGLQNIIGTDALLKGLKKVYLTMQDLDLKTTPAGYLAGSLKNMYEKALYQQKKVESVKRTAVDVTVKEKNQEDDPDVVGLDFFEKKAVLAGVSVEEMIKAYNAEKVGDNRYKINN